MDVGNDALPAASHIQTLINTATVQDGSIIVPPQTDTHSPSESTLTTDYCSVWSVISSREYLLVRICNLLTLTHQHAHSNLTHCCVLCVFWIWWSGIILSTDHISKGGIPRSMPDSWGSHIWDAFLQILINLHLWICVCWGAGWAGHHVQASYKFCRDQK